MALLERLGTRHSAAVTRLGRSRSAARALRTVKPLERWDGISRESYATYQAAGNVVRIKRVLDLLDAHERVLDIGVGFGYVGGILMRDGSLDYYCGTDIKGRWLDSARSMVAENGLERVPHHFEALDLYELSAEFVAEHNPTLVLLLEVLEHLDDPVRALTRIASTVPPGTRVIFTVPLLGRLEGVWGHRSVFGARRLQKMCRAAGLSVEQLEPVHNVWAMVVARAPHTAVKTDVQGATARVASDLSTFCYVSVADLAETYRRTRDTAQVLQLRPSASGLRCSARAPERAAAPASAGVRLPIAAPRVIRLELSIDPPGGALAVHVTGHASAGGERLHWIWDGRGGPILGRRMTHVLRPGRRSWTFKSKRSDDFDNVEWVEVWMELEPGAEATLTVHRAAYLGEGLREQEARRRPILANRRKSH